MSYFPLNRVELERTCPKVEVVITDRGIQGRDRNTGATQVQVFGTITPKLIDKFRMAYDTANRAGVLR